MTTTGTKRLTFEEMKLYKLPIVLYEPSEDTEYKYMAEAPDLPGCRAWRIRWEKRWTTFAV
jgi:hypothetical protein